MFSPKVMSKRLGDAVLDRNLQPYDHGGLFDTHCKYAKPAGRFGPQASGYISSIAPDYALSRTVICGRKEFSCSGG
jgi:hypothetical protein